MRRPIHVYEGQPGLAAILNRIMDVCQDAMIPDTEGGITDADLIRPSVILTIIEGDFQ